LNGGGYTFLNPQDLLGTWDRQIDRQTDGQITTLLNARSMMYGLYTGLL